MRIHKLIYATVVGVVMAAIGTAAPAQAWEVNDATLAPLASIVCDGGAIGSHANVSACFEKTGDVLWIAERGDPSYDFPYIQWLNELQDSRDRWVPYRSGECWLGVASEARVEGYCDKEFYEHRTYPNAADGSGSRIVFKACRQGHGCGSPEYVYNDA